MQGCFGVVTSVVISLAKNTTNMVVFQLILFNDMEELSGKSSIATLGVREKDLKDGSYKSKVTVFIKKIPIVNLINFFFIYNFSKNKSRIINISNVYN